MKKIHSCLHSFITCSDGEKHITSSIPLLKKNKSSLLNVLWSLDLQTTTGDSTRRKRLIVAIGLLVRMGLLTTVELIEHLDDFSLLEDAKLITSASLLQKRLVRLRTTLFYRQKRFNMLREEPEGYSRLISSCLRGSFESSDGSGSDGALLTVDHLNTLISKYFLDVPRVIQILIRAGNSSLTLPPAQLARLISQNPSPHREIAFCLANNLFTLAHILPYIKSPTDSPDAGIDIYSIPPPQKKKSFSPRNLLQEMYTNIMDNLSEAIDNCHVLRGIICELLRAAPTSMATTTTTITPPPTVLEEIFSKLSFSPSFILSIMPEILAFQNSRNDGDFSLFPHVIPPHLLFFLGLDCKALLSFSKTDPSILLDPSLHMMTPHVAGGVDGNVLQIPLVMADNNNNTATNTTTSSDTLFKKILDCPIDFGLKELYSKEINRLMRRLTNENVDTIGASLLSLGGGTSDLVGIPLILEKVMAFHSLIQPVAAALSGSGDVPLLLKIVVYCVVDLLKRRSSERLKEDGLNRQDWLIGLSEFMALLVHLMLKNKTYINAGVDFECGIACSLRPLFTFIRSSLIGGGDDGNLLFVRDYLIKTCGIGDGQHCTDEELISSAKRQQQQQQQGIDPSNPFIRGRKVFIKALGSSFIPFWSQVARERQRIVCLAEPDQNPKAVGLRLDECHMIFMQLSILVPLYCADVGGGVSMISPAALADINSLPTDQRQHIKRVLGFTDSEMTPFNLAKYPTIISNYTDANANGDCTTGNSSFFADLVQRSQMSVLDAFYCATNLCCGAGAVGLNTTNTNFNTKILPLLPSLLLSMTEREAHCFSRFIQVYFVIMSFRKDDDDDKYDDQLTQDLFSILKDSLLSCSFIRIRNAIILFSRLCASQEEIRRLIIANLVLVGGGSSDVGVDDFGSSVSGYNTKNNTETTKNKPLFSGSTEIISELKDLLMAVPITERPDLKVMLERFKGIINKLSLPSFTANIKATPIKREVGEIYSAKNDAGLQGEEEEDGCLIEDESPKKRIKTEMTRLSIVDKDRSGGGGGSGSNGGGGVGGGSENRGKYDKDGRSPSSYSNKDYKESRDSSSRSSSYYSRDSSEYNRDSREYNRDSRDSREDNRSNRDYRDSRDRPSSSRSSTSNSSSRSSNYYPRR